MSATAGELAQAESELRHVLRAVPDRVHTIREQRVDVPGRRLESPRAGDRSSIRAAGSCTVINIKHEPQRSDGGFPRLGIAAQSDLKVTSSSM